MAPDEQNKPGQKFYVFKKGHNGSLTYSGFKSVKMIDEKTEELKEDDDFDSDREWDQVYNFI